MPGLATIEDVLRQNAIGFAELVGTLHALRFTGAITLHVLNGQPQMVELGRPIQMRFPEHPANKNQASSTISVDRSGTPAASSSP